MAHPLERIRGHLCTRLECGGDGAHGAWLISTGVPRSFGASPFRFGGRTFECPPTCRFPQASGPLSVELLAEVTGVGGLRGVLGLDVLHEFDLVFDLPHGALDVSEDPIELEGTEVPVDVDWCPPELVAQLAGLTGDDPLPHDHLLPTPLLPAVVDGHEGRYFLETGSQFSYSLDLPKGPPATGESEDFIPFLWGYVVHPFDVRLVRAEVEIGGVPLGRVPMSRDLPPLVADLLRAVEATGVLGPGIFRDRRVGYFPRRHKLVFAP